MWRFFVFLITVMCWPTAAQAIVFSEVAYDIAGTDENREWIELYNDTTEPIDLTGYYFFDGAAHTLIVPPDKGSRGSLVLPPDQFLIVADDATTFIAEHPDYQGTVIDTVMSLPNYSSSQTSPQLLRLLDKTKQLVVEASYLPTTKGSSGYTLERQADGQLYDALAVGGSPGQMLSLATVTTHPTGLYLTEVLSNPAGRDDNAEWFELYNDTDAAIPIGEVIITDKSGSAASRQRIPTGTVIPPKSWYWQLLKGSLLNNTDEQLVLLWPDEQPLDSITLAGSADDDTAYARFTDGWHWTSLLTPGQANQLAAEPVSVPSVQRSSSATSSIKSPTASASTPKSPGGQTANPSPKESSVVTTKKSSPKSSAAAKKSTKQTKAKASPTISFPAELLPDRLQQVAGASDTAKGWSWTPLIFFLGLAGYLAYRWKLLDLIRRYWQRWRGLS